MLVRAADTGSFASAAKVLDITPSAISRGIGDLEKALQATLFNRTTRHLQLTEDGRRVYDRAREILERMSELEASVTPRGLRLAGTLRAGISAPLNRYVIMPRISTFLARHPDLQIELRVAQDARAMHVENIDVLLCVGKPPASRLVARRLGNGRPAAYASPEYLKRWGEPLDPEDLTRHQCLGFRPPWLTHPQVDWKFERDAVTKTVHITPAVISGDREGLIVAATAGAGIIYMACFDPALISTGKLCRLFPHWNCVESFNIYTLYRRNANSVPRISAFLHFVREAFAAFDPEERTVRHARTGTNR
jgi:LysR family transcriptional regulator, transcriptional activator for dmlA